MKEREKIINALSIMKGAMRGESLGSISEAFSLNQSKISSRVNISGLPDEVIAILDKHGLRTKSPDEVRRADAINAVSEIKDISTGYTDKIKIRVDELLSNINDVFGRKAIAKRLSVKSAERGGNRAVRQHMGATK